MYHQHQWMQKQTWLRGMSIPDTFKYVHPRYFRAHAHLVDAMASQFSLSNHIRGKLFVARVHRVLMEDVKGKVKAMAPIKRHIQSLIGTSNGISRLIDDPVAFVEAIIEAADLLEGWTVETLLDRLGGTNSGISRLIDDPVAFVKALIEAADLLKVLKGWTVETLLRRLGGTDSGISRLIDDPVAFVKALIKAADLLEGWTVETLLDRLGGTGSGISRLVDDPVAFVSRPRILANLARCQPCEMIARLGSIDTTWSSLSSVKVKDMKAVVTRAAKSFGMDAATFLGKIRLCNHFYSAKLFSGELVKMGAALMSRAERSDEYVACALSISNANEASKFWGEVMSGSTPRIDSQQYERRQEPTKRRNNSELDRSFKCKFCPAIFASQKALSTHIRNPSRRWLTLHQDGMQQAQ